MNLITNHVFQSSNGSEDENCIDLNKFSNYKTKIKLQDISLEKSHQHETVGVEITFKFKVS